MFFGYFGFISTYYYLESGNLINKNIQIEKSKSINSQLLIEVKNYQQKILELTKELDGKQLLILDLEKITADLVKEKEKQGLVPQGKDVKADLPKTKKFYGRKSTSTTDKKIEEFRILLSESEKMLSEIKNNKAGFIDRYENLFAALVGGVISLVGVLIAALLNHKYAMLRLKNDNNE